ncbi:hypothetical protein CC86DRAFT_470740 [Ophiobolus disseminans]|uniref:Uncharacterized protein n=1 Tax=Ophiobolus disseminans TaxID=1469910 RepID=A0A6A6ZMR1_9PLEO|nr:hypothetical protein CC86DRAFT_470740 [Ophiobolus disseminans]
MSSRLRHVPPVWPTDGEIYHEAKLLEPRVAQTGCIWDTEDSNQAEDVGMLEDGGRVREIENDDEAYHGAELLEPRVENSGWIREDEDSNQGEEVEMLDDIGRVWEIEGDDEAQHIQTSHEVDVKEVVQPTVENDVIRLDQSSPTH